MKVNKKKVAFLFITAVVFFIIGFRSGAKDGAGMKDLHNSPVHIPSEYVSDNQYKIDVLLYNINIDLDTEAKSIKGDVGITGIITDRELKQIYINFYDNFEIEGVWLNDEKTAYTHLKTRFTIPYHDISSDTFRIRIVYNGKPVRAGLSAFVFGTINGKSAVYNINEPTFASTWFPCNDIPSDKALLKINISNRSDKVSVSNGRLTGVKEKDGKKIYSWETVYPISTYLVAVYSSEYENFRDIYISRDGKDTMNIEYYAFPQHVEMAKIDFLEHPKMMEVFSEMFGEYPFIKEKYGVAEFLWQIGAMENQTITGIGSNFIGGSQYFTDIYVHELAHSWWGNSVGPETWKDIWLNEGFATYSEALYFERLHGEDALRSTMMTKFDENFNGRLYDPGPDLFSNTIYSKGAWVLHMLRWETGDSLFFDIIRKYYDQYKYSTASTRDFQQLVETITGKDYSWFFNQWVLEGEDQINLHYNWSYNKEGGTVTFKTKQVQEKYNVYKFSLETEIIYADSSEIKVLNVSERENSFTIPVKGEPEKITVDPKNRLLANYNEKDF